MDKVRQDLTGKEFSQSRVVDPGDLVEETRSVHPSLGHKKMKMGVKIDPKRGLFTVA